MGLFSIFKGEFIDVIDWLDDSGNTLVHRFERHKNEIKNGAQLTVREGQVAVFIDQGQIADVFGPGRHVLATENLPILSTLQSWPHAFESPFKAEVYFVNTRKFTDLKWGTKNPIILNDERFGMLEIRAFGTYVFKVSDPGLFIKEIVGTDGHFTHDEISGQLRSQIVAQFTDAAGEASLPVEAYAANNQELSTSIHELMTAQFTPLGIELSSFIIENISMPEEVKKEIFELSRLNKIDINRLAQLKSAKAIEKAAENPSGTAGAGLGMGMGFAMANQMGNAFGQSNTAAPSSNSNTPPPLPTEAAWFVAVGGKQEGPYDSQKLQALAQSGQLRPDTLVWKRGMANWAKAETIADIKGILGSVPPPLPS